MMLSDLPEELREAFSTTVVATIQKLQGKLTDAKTILTQINELKAQTDYKSASELQLQAVKVEETISKAKEIEDEMEKMKSNPSYMDPEEFKLCQKMVSEATRLKLFLKKYLQ